MDATFLKVPNVALCVLYPSTHMQQYILLLITIQMYVHVLAMFYCDNCACQKYYGYYKM